MAEKVGKRNDWNKDETILACELYCRTPYNKIDCRNPEIIELANLIGRTPGSVSLKLSNFASCDSEVKKQNKKGSSHTANLTKEVFAEYSNNLGELEHQANMIRAKMLNNDCSDSTQSQDNEDVTVVKLQKSLVKGEKINMSDFKKQIDEDLKEYAEKYPNIEHIDSPEWAFNFWVLDKLFSVDEELIESRIIDYNDKGIDCYVWHKDSLDLYLIQNKYYKEGTDVTAKYIMNDFLTRAIGALEKGTYDRCEELQDIYNHFSGEQDFHVYFYIYVTNNSSKKTSVVDAIAKYNQDNASKGREAKFFSLDDIEQTYFEETITDKKTFKYSINTVNKGTILSINNEAYETQLVVDAKYVLTPVITLYEMHNAAQQDGYQLFAENIREYLGALGSVNKKIKATLNDPDDRNNFFFYNNGITMIVDKIGKEETTKRGREFEVLNPQIVNGCQTVSTIWDTLSSLPVNSLDQDFKNVYVMVKILEIPQNTDDEKYKELYNDIVRYNNSQNSINEKAFVANENVFKRVQSEFRSKGFLVCLKQSDKYSFKKKYPTATKLRNANGRYLKRFGLEDLKDTKDFIVDLEKLLQVFLSFENNPTDAIQHKSQLLKPDSSQYRIVVDFIKNPNITSNAWLDLYLLYLKAEDLRKKNDKKSFNPFYLVYCFAKYECHGEEEKISFLLSAKEQISHIMLRYSKVLSRYYNSWVKKNDRKEYNDMIKSPIDQEMMDDIVEDVKDEEKETFVV